MDSISARNACVMLSPKDQKRIQTEDTTSITHRWIIIHLLEKIELYIFRLENPNANEREFNQSHAYDKIEELTDHDGISPKHDFMAHSKNPSNRILFRETSGSIPSFSADIKNPIQQMLTIKDWLLCAGQLFVKNYIEIYRPYKQQLNDTHSITLTSAAIDKLDAAAKLVGNYEITLPKLKSEDSEGIKDWAQATFDTLKPYEDDTLQPVKDYIQAVNKRYAVTSTDAIEKKPEVEAVKPASSTTATTTSQQTPPRLPMQTFEVDTPIPLSLWARLFGPKNPPPTYANDKFKPTRPRSGAVSKSN